MRQCKCEYNGVYILLCNDKRTITTKNYIKKYNINKTQYNIIEEGEDREGRLDAYNNNIIIYRIGLSVVFR